MQASIGERKIHDILANNGILFKEEYTFDDLVSSSGRKLRFDFAILNDDGTIDALIEFNGIQHYQPIPKFGGVKGLKRQQYNDNLKRRYCLKNNYRLITIPYYEEDKITYDYLMMMIY